MSARAAIAAFCAGAALTAAALLGGCGQGDIVALPAPGGATEWPLDPHWILLSPLAGDNELLDADWRPDPAGADSGQAVIVGERGVVLWRDGARLHREDAGADADLLDVALLDDAGAALAVGRGGTAVRRTPAAWRREDTGARADLRRLTRDGGNWWAVGAAGTALRRDASGWRDLSAPTAATFVSAAVHDGALYAGANDGALWRLDADGAWQSAATPWDTLFAAGLAVSGRGDLFAMADSLYRLTPQGWTAVLYESWLPSRDDGWRLLAAGDTLYLATGEELLRVRPYDDDPRFDWATGFGNGAAVAGSRLLSVGERQIQWRDPGASRLDPAGLVRYQNWVDFEDGSSGLYSSDGLFLADRQGLVLHTDREQLRPDGNSPLRLWGADPDDLLGVFWDDVIRRRQGGAWSVVAPCEEGYDVTSLALDGQGRCLMATDRGLARWTGSQWDWILGRAEDGPDISTGRHFVRRGGAGDLLAWDGRGMVYRERDGDWHVLTDIDEVGWVVQDAAGDVYVFGYSWSIGPDPSRTVTLVRPGAGQVRVYGDETLGVMDGRRLGGVTDRTGEVLVWTRDPEMVYRLAGSAGALDWELVAGVLPSEINGLGVLADGSLFTAARTGEVYHYRRP